MPEIKFNSKEEVDELDSFIDRILDAMGHPTAYINNETTLYDFGSFNDLTEYRFVKKIRMEFDITVNIQDTIVSIAQKIKDQEMSL